MNYYLTIFGDQSQTIQENPIVSNFSIYGHPLAILNGGDRTEAILTPAISFSLWITDKDQTKHIRNQLSDGGSVLMDFADYPWSKGYGWCNDKYGVSRQVMYDDRPESSSNKLIPSFLFVQDNNGKAQSAMEFYTSIFPNSKIENSRLYTGDEGETAGNLAHAEFTLNNQLFIATDSSQDHKFSFSEGVSLSIECDGQEQVDYYWEKLISDGGSESMCGRCKDKFGVSRQVVPKQLIEAMSQSDRDAAMFAMSRMQTMKKIVIADLYQ